MENKISFLAMLQIKKISIISSIVAQYAGGLSAKRISLGFPAYNKHIKTYRIVAASGK